MRDALTNALSFADVPRSLMSDADLMEWTRRAVRGEDVYAYDAGPDHFWNIWDGETIDQDTGYKGVRIELGVEHG